VSNVFVIINEWTTINRATGSEIVGYKYFGSEESAWRALRLIAHSRDDDLDYDSTSLVYQDPSPHIEFEEYYIQELTKGDD
jgi:hypothetical protein